MLINFEQLPAEARLWVYQASRTFTGGEQNLIEHYLAKGISGWAAHGAALTGAFQIVEDRFVVIAVNEDINAPSGCSIDASTHWLKELGQSLNIDFFDRSVVFLKDKQLRAYQPLQVKKAVEAGELTASDLVFDNLITNVQDFRKAFLKPAHQTWMKRFFEVTAR